MTDDNAGCLVDQRPKVDTADYRYAMSGIGPLAGQWSDKPHRLIYDLCGEIEWLRSERDRHLVACRLLVAALDGHSEDHDFGEADEKALEAGKTALASFDRAAGEDHP